MKITTPLHGIISVPGDKSISHRGIMLGALAEGTTKLRGFLDGADCRSTIQCFRQMGIEIEQDHTTVRIQGKGLQGLQKSEEMLYTGNSGTTTRIISGILCGQQFATTLTGDASIEKRPMKRIIDPLTEMGADIRSVKDNGCAPLSIQPAALHGITYHTPVASAQVKSAILFAGLYADSPTTVIEPALSRDHTERMIRGFGGEVLSDGVQSTVTPHPHFYGQRIDIPGDISSAAYFIAAALIVPCSDLVIRNVNTNPTRDGILKVAKQMGGLIEEINPRTVSGEPVSDLHVQYSPLHGITIGGDLIPTLIDEIPVIAVIASCAEGTTTIQDAAELKVKETDRIKTITENLSAMGCAITPTEDGMIIQGPASLHGARITTGHDHRIAMAFTIASLVADGEVILDDPGCVDISYPEFYKTLKEAIA